MAANPGATKAKAAAIASGALLALPQWPEDAPEHLTDFNDLAVWLARGGV
jgi:putative DNA primase/helicase